jgi:hypothetical protein
MTGKRSSQFDGHAIAKTPRRGRVDLRVEPGHQPAADALRHAAIALVRSSRLLIVLIRDCLICLLLAGR